MALLVLSQYVEESYATDLLSDTPIPADCISTFEAQAWFVMIN